MEISFSLIVTDVLTLAYISSDLILSKLIAFISRLDVRSLHSLHSLFSLSISAMTAPEVLANRLRLDTGRQS